MSTSVAVMRPSYSICLDDELAALALQLEELGLASQPGKGKHPVDQPPDFEIASASFQAELDGYHAFLRDQKLAQSMGAAVHMDGALILDLTSQDIQAHEDRRFVRQLSADDPDIEALPQSAKVDIQDDIEDWMSTITKSIAAQPVTEYSDDESEAGPSMTYAERQADIMKKMSTEFQCTICTDRFPRANMVSTKCSHRYCASCIKKFFMQSTKDEDLYPPKCCKQPIPLPLVAKHMSADELATFQMAVIEFATPDRVYCSNGSCRRFIKPDDIESGAQHATCQHCGMQTCTICKNDYHYGLDCPDDPSLRQTRELAQELGWQTCNVCKRLVQLRSGCNHITCRCGSEFCYVCGTPWKNCICPVADINRIEERAEEIVERDAPQHLPDVERRARVNRVRAELQDNHECEHSRVFQRIIWNMPRRGFRCELCDDRHWKYILQCRLCYINVCESCRRHRI